MMTTDQQREYELSITVTRHGPKESLGGKLSPTGEESVLKHYKNSAQTLASSQLTKRKLVTSPIHRAVQTAYIYKGVLESHIEPIEVSVEEDERLSEKDIVDFVNQLPQEKKEDWFQYWYQSEKGSKAIKDFSGWLIEQIEKQKQVGGVLHIDAFSHGPIMAGFVLKVEELIDEQLLGPVSDGAHRLGFSRLFSEHGNLFNYLSNIQFRLESENPDNLVIQLKGKEYSIPVTTLFVI